MPGDEDVPEKKADAPAPQESSGRAATVTPEDINAFLGTLREVIASGGLARAATTQVVRRSWLDEVAQRMLRRDLEAAARGEGPLASRPPIAGAPPPPPPAPPAPPPPKRTREEVLAEAVPETKIPGYWTTLESNAETWAEEVSVQPFWKAVRSAAGTWSTDYHREKGADLLPKAGVPMFQGKRLPRLREKTLAAIGDTGEHVTVVFRGGVPVPRIKDLVRVRIATSFLDGVDFVSERLMALLKEHGRSPEIDAPRARASGYYAKHIYFEYERAFQFNRTWTIPVKCEIQIATELSTTIWDRTHGAYELARVVSEDDLGWQWDGNDPRFLASQLAHMIHLADGLVVRLRDRLREMKGPKR